METSHVLSIFLFMIVLQGCKNKMITTHYDDGTVYEVYGYVGDSIIHGPYNRYSEKGVLLEKSTYDHGKLTGIRKIYREDGSLEVVEKYNDDVLDGTFQSFYPNGKLKLEGEYIKNVLTGWVKGYYDTGELKEEVWFEDNVENGPFKEYYKNGIVKWEGKYRNGSNEFGLIKEYDKNGMLIRKMMCDSNAVCTTIWKKQ